MMASKCHLGTAAWGSLHQREIIDRLCFGYTALVVKILGKFNRCRQNLTGLEKLSLIGDS